MLRSLLNLGILLLAAAAPALAAAPVVDNLTASSTAVLPGGTVTLTVEAHDPDCTDTCTSGCGQYIRADISRWSATGGTLVNTDMGTSGSPYTATTDWQAPAVEGVYTITVDLADSGSFMCGGRQSTSANLDIQVTTVVNEPPVVTSLTVEPAQVLPDQTANLVCTATDPDGDDGLLQYTWETDLGTVTPGAGGSAQFVSAGVGVADVTCTATDPDGGFGSDSIGISVTDAMPEKSIHAGLVEPRRLSVDSDGNVFVIDRGAGGLVVVNLFSGELVYRLPLPGAGSIAVDWNDNLLIGGRTGARVVDRLGAPVLDLSTSSNLGRVADVAVDAVNRRYGVLFRSTGRVQVYDELGAPTVSFGATGDGPDQFKGPLGLAADPSGNWVVADTGHGLIKVFDAAGSLVNSFGGQGGGAGEFVRLDAVGVSDAGSIFASDGFQDWVQVFAPDGTARDTLGTYGTEVGQFKTAAGIAAAPSWDRLLIASVNSASIQVFRTSNEPLGEVPAPAAQLSATSLGFGAVEVGAESTAQTVVLENTGTAILGVRGAQVSPHFTQSHDCPPFLDPGSTCTFSVTFLPRSVGLLGGTLSIDTSAGNPLEVGLEGEAVGAADLSLVPSRLVFPSQWVGTVSDPVDFTLSNLGTLPLDLLDISTSDQFLHSTNCAATLAGGASCSIAVSFAPDTAEELIAGLLTVTSNAAGGPRSSQLEGSSQLGVVMGVDDVSVEEGDGEAVSAVFEVTLTAPSDETVTADYETVATTASDGEDFEAVAGQLAWAAGETLKTISVPILGDRILEPAEEYFAVELTNVSGAILNDGTGLGTIVDDEVCLGFELLNNPGAEKNVGAQPIPGWTVVNGASWQTRTGDPGPAEGDAYFYTGTAEPAELVQTVDVSAFAQQIDAGGQMFAFRGYLRTEAGDQARIVVEYRDDADNVLESYDSGGQTTLTWLPMPGIENDVRVAPTGTRSIRVRLLGQKISGGPTGVYFDALRLRSVGTATLTVSGPADYEGNTGITDKPFTVSMSCPFYQEVVLDYTTQDGDAVANQDYQPTSGRLTLQVGETSSEVPVGVIGDQTDEPHETFFLALDLVAGDAVLVDGFGVQVITNDDFCPRTAQYWSDHPELWPTDHLVMGGYDYDAAHLAALFDYQGGDASSKLARELAATRFNLKVGSDPSILPVVEQADAFLVAWPPGSRLDNDAMTQAKDLARALEDYNGATCPAGTRLNLEEWGDGKAGVGSWDPGTWGDGGKRKKIERRRP